MGSVLHKHFKNALCRKKKSWHKSERFKLFIRREANISHVLLQLTWVWSVVQRTGQWEPQESLTKMGGYLSWAWQIWQWAKPSIFPLVWPGICSGNLFTGFRTHGFAQLPTGQGRAVWTDCRPRCWPLTCLLKAQTPATGHRIFQADHSPVLSNEKPVWKGKLENTTEPLKSTNFHKHFTETIILRNWPISVKKINEKIVSPPNILHYSI